MSLIRPVKGNYRISQEFGNDLVINGVHVYQKLGLIGHNGEDIACPLRTPVYACISGTVKEASFDAAGYGWYPLIENDEFGVLTGHMDELLVKAEQIVKQGDLIGYSGNTGNSTGPHIHWGVYKKPRNRNNGYNGYENPEFYVDKGVTTMPEVTSTQGTISAEYVQQIEKDREMFWQQRDEALKQIEDLKTQLADLHTTIDEKFKFLGEIQDLGFTNIDDLKKVVDPYRDMYKQGYISLEVIQAKLAGFTIQQEDNQKTIKDLQDRLDATIKAGIQNEQDKINLQKELDDLKKQVPLVDPKSVFNYIARFLELLKQLKPNNKLLQQADMVMNSVKPDTMTAATKAWNELTNTIKSTN